MNKQNKKRRIFLSAVCLLENIFFKMVFLESELFLNIW
jgi:hypothetical protein